MQLIVKSDSALHLRALKNIAVVLVVALNLKVGYASGDEDSLAHNGNCLHVDTALIPWAGKLTAPGNVRVAVPSLAEEGHAHLAWPKAIRTSNGTILLAYLAGNFHGTHGGHSPAVSISYDDGKTFGAPRILKDFSSDREYTASGNLAMGIAEDGAIVLLAMGFRGNESNHIFGWRSVDDGKSWDTVDTDALGPNKTGSVCGTIVQLPDQRLMVMGHYRKGAAPYQTGIWQSISLDNGKSWGKPRMVTNINGGEPVLVRTGNRLLAFIRGRGVGATHQYLAISDNYGETWRVELTDIVAQNDHTKGLAHPFAMVNPTKEDELMVITVERPLPGSVWLWRGGVKDLDFKIDKLLMEIPDVDGDRRPDYGYTWLLALGDNRYLMFYYHGLSRGDNSIWVAEFELN
ncbi:sialidase family protein [Parapedobacter sp. 10938]|uniref:sialidase family protein n=1 Tax=Parapedobacter flavus TaxID=3110225 RepID=UPI002DC06152|nr:sialidase family protein [Parapedobacter sp. 10938]MEC3878972.1 sialidase family protein [Parapedobacter sp. 10938]